MLTGAVVVPASRPKTVRAFWLLVLAAMGVILFGPGTLLVRAAFADITEYTPPTPRGTFLSMPVDITSGPDGNLWFTERNGRAVGRITPSGVITEFLLPTSNAIPDGITVGPDGWIWFTESQASTGRLGRINPLAPDPGSTVEEPLLMNPTNAGPTFIVTGPDGNLWFTERRAHKIGRYNPVTRQLAEFRVPGGNPRLIGITVGPDDNIWFTEQFGNKIGRITLDGVITEFPVPTDFADPTYIVAGPDGNLWFTEYGCISDAGSSRRNCNPSSAPEPGNRIAFLDPIAETITELPVLPTNNSKPAGLVFDVDGTLWFTEQAGNKVASLDDLGVVTEYAIGISPESLPTAITVGPDGNLWFAEFYGEDADGVGLGGKIAKFDLAVPPAVSGLNPSSGPASGGTSVTVTGTGFKPGTTVTFGANPATSVTCGSATQCSATSPAGAGMVDVLVTVDGKTSAPSAGSKFGYVPSVTQVSPTSGPAIGGTVVNITGTGFKPGATVRFGPNLATAVSCGSATQCSARSPAGAGTVDVLVIVDAQTSAPSAGSKFRYI